VAGDIHRAQSHLIEKPDEPGNEFFQPAAVTQLLAYPMAGHVYGNDAMAPGKEGDLRRPGFQSHSNAMDQNHGLTFARLVIGSAASGRLSIEDRLLYQVALRDW
jgi:hypothetical protein